MAEGAIVGNFSRRVAVHASRHACGHFFGQDLTLIDMAVTGGTLFSSLQVVRVAEEHEVRHTVDAYPFQFLSTPMDCGESLDFRAVGFDRGMAHHTLLRVRQPRLLLVTDARMSVQAWHALRQMPLVAKAERLRCYPDGQFT